MWRPDPDANAVIYEAWIEGALEVLRHLARPVNQACFEPTHDDQGRGACSRCRARSRMP